MNHAISLLQTVLCRRSVQALLLVASATATALLVHSGTPVLAPWRRHEHVDVALGLAVVVAFLCGVHSGVQRRSQVERVAWLGAFAILSAAAVPLYWLIAMVRPRST
jgi:4-amino-4-deoxy-L-arabinose transferase-like glycosyltransferase